MSYCWFLSPIHVNFKLFPIFNGEVEPAHNLSPVFLLHLTTLTLLIPQLSHMPPKRSHSTTSSSSSTRKNTPRIKPVKVPPPLPPYAPPPTSTQMLKTARRSFCQYIFKCSTLFGESLTSEGNYIGHMHHPHHSKQANGQVIFQPSDTKGDKCVAVLTKAENQNLEPFLTDALNTYIGRFAIVSHFPVELNITEKYAVSFSSDHINLTDIKGRSLIPHCPNLLREIYVDQNPSESLSDNDNFLLLLDFKTRELSKALTVFIRAKR